MAYSVIIAHTNPIFGFVGIADHAVTAFFVISGFYMQLVLHERYKINSGLLAFYINRALRIFPSYWIVIFAMSLIAICGDGGYYLLTRMHGQSANSLHLATSGDAASLLTAIPNLFIIGSDVARLFCVSHTTGHLIVHYNSTPQCFDTFYYEMFPPAWTLSIELMFYLVAPFLAPLSKRNMLLWMFVIERLDVYLNSLNLGPSQLMFWNSINYFILGMIVCKFYRQSRLFSIPAFSIFGAIPFAFVILYPQIDLMMTSADKRWLAWLLFAIGIAVLFDKTKNSKIDRLIGDLSYAIYLIHFQFAWPLWEFGSLAAPMTAAVSTGLAVLLVIGVERPINKFRRRLSVKKNLNNAWEQTGVGAVSVAT